MFFLDLTCSHRITGKKETKRVTKHVNAFLSVSEPDMQRMYVWVCVFDGCGLFNFLVVGHPSGWPYANAAAPHSDGLNYRAYSILWWPMLCLVC